MTRWFLAHSIRTQLVTLLFGLTAIAIVVISYLGISSLIQSGNQAQQITSGAMKQRVQQFLQQTATAAADKNSLIFSNIQHRSNSATAYAEYILDNPSPFAGSGWKYDTHIQPAPGGGGMNDATETSSVYIPPDAQVNASLKNEMALTTYLDGLFPSVLASEPNAVAMYFIGTQGETRYYPNIGLGSIVPPAYTPVTDVFYTPITPQNDPKKTAQWSVVYNDPASNGLLVTSANPIYTKAGFAGMVGIDVTLTNVAKNIASYTPIESSYSFLINNDGRAIALPAQAYRDILGRAPKKDEFGADLSGAKGDFGSVLKKMRAGSTGFNVVQASGHPLEVAYAPVKGTTFSLAIVAQQSVLLKVVSDLQDQVNDTTTQVIYGRVLPIGLGLLAVIWVYGFIYIKRFTEPLNQLTAKTAQLSAGDFNIEPEIVNTQNEIGKLAGSFNSMVADLRASHAKIEDQNQALIREQSRLKASIKSLPFGFAIINPDDEIVFHNAALTKLFGRHLPSDPARSRATLALIDKDFHEAISLLDCIHTSQSEHHAIERNVELGPRFYRFFIMPIIDETAKGDSTSIGVVLIMEDTTDSKAAERSRDEFFSIASHELRTPLTAIRGNSQMILDYYKGALKDPLLGEIVGDIHESSVRLMEIVNDFLDTSRLEQGKLVFKLENFDASEIAAKVIREFTVASPSNKLNLELVPLKGAAPRVYADIDRTHQILTNLLSNAIKFTDKGSVKVTFARLPKTLKISVADTGKGIPVESQHLLFRKFQQASNNILTRDNSRSTGLGLYISKLVAEGMNGHLSLDKTEVGKGSTFSVELPLATDGGAVKPTNPGPKSANE